MVTQIYTRYYRICILVSKSIGCKTNIALGCLSVPLNIINMWKLYLHVGSWQSLEIKFPVMIHARLWISFIIYSIQTWDVHKISVSGEQWNALPDALLSGPWWRTWSIPKCRGPTQQSSISFELHTQDWKLLLLKWHTLSRQYNKPQSSPSQSD